MKRYVYFEIKVDIVIIMNVYSLILSYVLLHTAVSSSHNPPLIDQGATAEVEASGVLKLDFRFINQL